MHQSAKLRKEREKERKRCLTIRLDTTPLLHHKAICPHRLIGFNRPTEATGSCNICTVWYMQIYTHVSDPARKSTQSLLQSIQFRGSRQWGEMGTTEDPGSRKDVKFGVLEVWSFKSSRAQDLVLRRTIFATPHAPPNTPYKYDRGEVCGGKNVYHHFRS
jgi:hypothetical protein